jgi:hypothetical protein
MTATLAGPQTEATRRMIDAVITDLGPSRLSRYRVTLRFTGKLLAGVPKDPEIIDAWLRKNLPEASDQEIKQKMLETLADLGVDVDSVSVNGEPNWEAIVEASRALADEKKTNGFKVNPETGLYYEGRCCKAALKECASIVFTGKKWGVTRKGTKNFVAERIFVLEDEIPLGRWKPDGVELIIGHIAGPQGERSTLTRHEYVTGAQITFTLLALDDCFEAEDWYATFDLLEWNGLGAARSQQHGRVEVVAFEELTRLPRHWTITRATD